MTEAEKLDEEKSTRYLRRCKRLPTQYLLAFEMIGLEACIAFEIIFVIANFQTLGVPMKCSSIPAVVSAVAGVILIPSFGILMRKLGNTLWAKAIVLSSATVFELTGILLLFFANVIKLAYYDDYTITEEIRIVNNETQDENIRHSHNCQVLHNITDKSSLRINIPINCSNSNTSSEAFLDGQREFLLESQETIPLYALLAMAGFAFMDFGYDSSNCFLKTFALAAVSPQDQAGIIVKLTWVSSLGGCLVAILGSMGLGDLLPDGTFHDKNAAQCAFITALLFVILVASHIITLTTGLCCRPSGESPLEDTIIFENLSDDEKTHLITVKNSPPAMVLQQPNDHNSNEGGGMKNNGYLHTGLDQLTASKEFKTRETVGDTNRNKFVQCIIKNKKLILLNVSTFFLMSAMYSWSIYSTNFVGQGIYHGDPEAAVNSPENNRYIEGIKSGSFGALLWYISFSLSSANQARVLDKVGWKTEMVVVFSVEIVFSLVCAISTNIWVFYANALWTGIARTAIYSVPFVLANQLVKEQKGQDNTAGAIVITSSMLPAGFVLCVTTVGPLIDLTKSSATNLYYTAVMGSIGLLVMCLIKSEEE